MSVCCNYDEHCPEWTVIKNKLIIVDDWNDYLVCDLDRVDDMFCCCVTECKNTNGIEIDYTDNDQNHFIIAMVQKQFKQLIKDWEKFYNKNKKMFEEEM